MQTLRTDIQVLRAIAVLSVLVFHFDLPGLHKGFLGVDIFFVISGYLMSKVIIEEMDQGHFSPKAFYLRRARRLLPAAWTMLALVTFVAPFTLTAGAMESYVQQLLGALGFCANMVLWGQSGYFDEQATLKPLLHTWSLAVEEQYYFVLPLLLAWVARRWRVAVLGALCVGSWLVCQALITRDPSGAFYLLPARAWELLLGSLCALPPVGRRMRVLMPDWGWLWLAIMGWCLAKGLDAVHPRWDAVLVCVSTAALLLKPAALLQSRKMWMRPLHWTGNVSYSLYLIHWPLIALAKNVWLEGVPKLVLAGLLLLSLALADLSYRFIEQRWRHAATPEALMRGLAWLAAPLLASLVWTTWQWQAHERVDQMASKDAVYGFARACDMDASDVFKPIAACVRGPGRPRTLVWGDSYAMHLIPALLASPPKGGLIQATRSACGPSLDMARQVPHDPPDRGQRCIAFNQSVMRYLRSHPEVDRVVLSGRWQYYFDDPVVDAQGYGIRPDEAAIAHSFKQLVDQLRAMRKRVILISPPALLGPDADLGQCGERAAQSLVTVTSTLRADCSFERRRYEARQARVLRVLDAVASSANLEVVRLDAFNCDATHCATQINHIPLYRDFGHYSLEGARLLGGRLELGKRVDAKAR